MLLSGPADLPPYHLKLMDLSSYNSCSLVCHVYILSFSPIFSLSFSPIFPLFLLYTFPYYCITSLVFMKSLLEKELLCKQFQ